MFVKMYKERYMRYPEGKTKAVTFSYDDGVYADKRLIEIFKKYGMKATFNINSELFDAQCWKNRMDERQTYSAFKDSGFEVAMHGARHVFFDKVPLPLAVSEIIDNRRYLEAKFGCIVQGLAYAYNSYNEDILGVIGKLGVKYARTTNSTYAFTLPENWLEWNPTCHHNDAELNNLTQKFLSADPLKIEKHRESLLFYVWGHSFEFDEDDNWNVIEELCRKLSQSSENIWFATNSEIYSYVKAYENLAWSADGESALNTSYMPVWVEIRGKTYRIDGGKTVKFDK